MAEDDDAKTALTDAAQASPPSSNEDSDVRVHARSLPSTGNGKRSRTSEPAARYACGDDDVADVASLTLRRRPGERRGGQRVRPQRLHVRVRVSASAWVQLVSSRIGRGPHGLAGHGVRRGAPTQPKPRLGRASAHVTDTHPRVGQRRPTHPARHKTLCALGMATVQVLAGALAVYGEVFVAGHAPVTVFSPATHALVMLEPVKPATAPSQRPSPPEDVGTLGAALAVLLESDHWDAVVLLRPVLARPWANLLATPGFEAIFAGPTVRQTPCCVSRSCLAAPDRTARWQRPRPTCMSGVPRRGRRPPVRICWRCRVGASTAPSTRSVAAITTRKAAQAPALTCVRIPSVSESWGRQVFVPPPNAVALTITPEWHDCLASIAAAGAPGDGHRAPVVMTVGGKNAGTSTFGRLLLNRLVARCVHLFAVGGRRPSDGSRASHVRAAPPRGWGGGSAARPLPLHAPGAPDVAGFRQVGRGGVHRDGPWPNRVYPERHVGVARDQQASHWYGACSCPTPSGRCAHPPGLRVQV